MEHDDDSDTSSEDDEDDVEASAEDMEAIMTLEHSLQSSPQSYELHAQVIDPPHPPPPSATGLLSPFVSLSSFCAESSQLDCSEGVARRSMSPC